MDAAARARPLLLLGAASGFAAVVLGAFGAHALQPRLGADQLRIWDKAVDYQALHALALLAAGLLARSSRDAAALWAGSLLFLGSVLFSGSLYLLALGGPRWLGPLTPLGGLCFLAGWAGLAVAAWRLPRGAAP